MVKIAKNEIIHFIGIGGIGMSGLSLIMKKKGFKVQGSDIALNKNIKRLKKENIRIKIKHDKKNLKDATTVVISSAIKKNNIELIEAKKKKLTILTRGEMLAHLVFLMKNIVVTGSHGKTTTTSLLASILQETSIDPTVISGGVIKALKNNAKLGKSDWSLLEADESDGSFIHINPTYSIITNIDKEHMNFYKTILNLKKYFLNFINKTPYFGKVFICLDDKLNNEIIKNIDIKKLCTYGVKKNSDFLIKNFKQKINFTEYDLYIKNDKIKITKIRIPLLGMHNVRNSAAAAALSYTMGVSASKIKKGLSNFKGVERRFNKIFTYNEIDFYDDYAHHPTEIKEVLEGVNQAYRNFEKVCIFEPHRISRLKSLKKEFSFAFKKADIVVLCPIYSAGEKIKLNFTYEKFAKEIIRNSNVRLIMINNYNELKIFIKKMHGKKIVVAMGAGSISNWIKLISRSI